MRLHRPLALLALLASVPAHASTPPERFVPDDATMVVVFPSLEVLARQATDLLATASSFPGGEKLLDGRAVLARRLGFDLFDPASVKAAGLDPRGGAAVTLRMADPKDDGEVVFALPVVSATRFEASFRRLAREQLKLRSQEVQPGKPAVTVWRTEKGGKISLAYALVQGTALVGFGPAAVGEIRAAASVGKEQSVGASAGYRSVVRTLGGGLSVVFYFPPDSILIRDTPGLDRGFGAGLAAGKDRVRAPFAVLLAQDAPMISARKVDVSALLEKLDPNASMVVRNSADMRAFLPPDDVAAALRKEKAPDDVKALFREALDSAGSGMVMSFGLVPVAGDAIPSFKKETFAFFRGELVMGLSDPARMKKAIRRALLDSSKGKTEVSADGPWVFPVPGGELGLAVAEERLHVAVGPTGCLDALLRRTGTRFQAPTQTSARAFAAPLAGLYVDVPAAMAGVKAIPEEAYRDDPKGESTYRSGQEMAEMLSRVRAISAGTELVGAVQRTEVVVEVQPAED